jgi:hypothetical protein
MDAARFDRLTRALTDVRSRRGALASVLGGSLGLLGLAATTAKKGKGNGKKKNKNKNKKKGSGNQSPSPPPGALASSCSDGIKNGNETDVDCGGSCLPCANDQRCATQADCASSFCVNSTCQACTSNQQNQECGYDAYGNVCFCGLPAAGGSKVCHRSFTTGPGVPNCAACPPGSICVSDPPSGFDCYPPCA